MKKWIAMLLCLILLIGAAAGAAFAAEMEFYIPENRSISLVDEPFPVETEIQDIGGVSVLEKTYYLKEKDDPTRIPTEPIIWNNTRYLFSELRKEEPNVKTYRETVTMESSTNNLKEILKVLAATKEIETDDYYRGTLILDPASIAITASGYKNRSYPVSVTRSYPNLSDADTSLIPKTITDRGRTLTLQDISWQNAANDYVDGYELAMRYTAVATYNSTVNSKVATGYLVSADYYGDVTSCESSYTVVYEEVNTGWPFDIPEGVSIFLYLLLAVVMIAGFIAAVYFGKKQYTHYINKKRGYEE